MKNWLSIYALFLSSHFTCWSFKVATFPRQIGSSRLLRQQARTAPVRREIARLNLLSSESINPKIRQGSAQNATAAKSLKSVTPTSVALGSIATLSAGTVYWAMLTDPVITNDKATTVRSAQSAGSLATRQAVSSALQSLATASALPLAVFVVWKFLLQQDEQSFLKEMKRVQQYKEEMYFEAVQDIFIKLNSPDVSFANAENLRRQLVVLDPDGSIRQYVIGGGKRPDISNLVQKNAERYSRRSRGPKATLSLLDSKTVEGNLKDLLQSIDSKLYLKFDAAMRQRIGDKIKKSFSEFDEVQARQALKVLLGNIDNELYWNEFVDKLS